MHFVYELYDSRTGQVGYVGQTQDPERRMYFHRSSGGNRYLAAWKASVGRSLSMRIVRACEHKKDADFLESWIIGWRRARHFLCNMHDGGDFEPNDFSGVSDPVEIYDQATARTRAVIFPRGLHGHRDAYVVRRFGKLGPLPEAMPCVDRGRRLSPEERRAVAAKLGLKSA